LLFKFLLLLKVMHSSPELSDTVYLRPSFTVKLATLVHPIGLIDNSSNTMGEEFPLWPHKIDRTCNERCFCSSEGRMLIY
jgi:hypothetical protein